MSRRSKRDSGLLGFLIIGAGLVYVGSKLLDGLKDNPAPVLLGAAVTIAILAYFFIVAPRQEHSAMLRNVDAIADANIDALIRQQAILVRSDAYGKPILDKWQTEVSYFIAQHIRPALNPALCKILDRNQSAITVRVMQRVATTAQTRPALATLPVNMTPAGFEAYCAESLRARGWAVSLTPLCRDQGVDVIAEKNGLRVVLQCKLYSNPVGNKAVQEIAAGRVHQQAHCGAVVTNSMYTEAAKQLAATNGIWLLHHSDLPKLEGMLFQLSAK